METERQREIELALDVFARFIAIIAAGHAPKDSAEIRELIEIAKRYVRQRDGH